MPLVDLSFSFHQTVGLVIETDDVLAREFFQSEYGPHAGPVGGLPTIHLRFQRREALLSVPAGYTFHAHKLVARWAFMWHGARMASHWTASATVSASQ